MLNLRKQTLVSSFSCLLKLLYPVANSRALRWTLGPAHEFLIALTLIANRRFDEAVGRLRSYITQRPKAYVARAVLAGVLLHQKKRWEEIQVLKALTQLRPRKARWYARLGDAFSVMARWDEAARAYRRANELRGGKKYWHYREGFALEMLGDVDGSMLAYERAISLDKTLGARQFGIGAFHQLFDRWPMAMEAYARTLEITGEKAPFELYYRAGYASERCMRWEEASRFYRIAVKANEPHAAWFSRLGLCCERLQYWEEAVSAYKRAADIDHANRALYLYRAGYVYARLHRYEEACVIFVKMAFDVELVRDETPNPTVTDIKDWSDIHTLRALAFSTYISEDWMRAAELLRELVERSSAHRHLDHYCLGVALYRLGRYEEATSAFVNSRTIRTHHGAPTGTYRTNVNVRRSTQFVEYMQNERLVDRWIVYESYHGRSISCNPFAIYLEAINDRRFDGFRHIWVVNDRSAIPEWMRLRRDTVFVTRESHLYVRYIATAKYIICNTSLPTYYIRREGQMYLNTWHGTPIKYIGRRVKNEFVGWRNISRNLLHATHVIVPNEHTCHALTSDHHISSLLTARIGATGYPRVDLTLAPSELMREQLRKELSLDPTKPTVLYAPTFRGRVGNAKTEEAIVENVLLELLEQSYNVLYRGHYFTSVSGEKSPAQICSIPSYIDTNVLLSVVDVLITDYSSIAIDFLPTKRPIIFYAYDLEQYEEERGLYFALDTLGVPVCRDLPSVIKEVANALKKGGKGDEGIRERALKSFCPLEDGNATKRAIDFFFFNSEEYLRPSDQDTRTRILIFPGQFQPHGITAALINLLTALDDSKYDITLIVEPNRISADADRIRQFERIPPNVRVLARTGGYAISLEERWAIDQFNKSNCLYSDAMEAVYTSALQREYCRLLGDVRFDVAIHYDGYGHLFTSLLGRIPERFETRKVIYQHNDMYEEWRTKYPSLAGTFFEYDRYDAIVSVSEKTMEVNRQRLACRFGLREDAFVYSENIIDPRTIIARAGESIESSVDYQLFGERGDTTLFLNVARLSPEKGQDRLIRAFYRIHQEFPRSMLVILGEGPQRSDLERLIADLHLEHSVRLLGHRMNPFQLMKMADCFVLSSRHEGQGLVLLESMILGVPTIATDLPCVRDVLKGGKGLIVPDSEDGLVDGMMSYLRGDVPTPTFDGDAYRAETLNRFHRVVLGERQ